MNSDIKITWLINKLSKYILDGVAAFQCKTTASTPTEKPLHVQELVIHLALQLSKRRTVPCHPSSVAFSLALDGTSALAAGQPQPAACDRESCRQCQSLPPWPCLSLEMVQDSLMQLQAGCGKIHLASIQCCMNAGCPTPKGHYDLVTNHFPLFILSYKAVALLRHLLSGLSYWDPDRTLHHVSLSPHPMTLLQCRTTAAFDLLPHLLQICFGQPYTTVELSRT